MGLAKKSPRRRASITSLIDVIFLLLLFFMLSSTFSKFSEIEVSTAMSSQGGLVEKDDTNTIRLTIGENRFLIDGSSYSDDNLIKTLLKNDGNLGPILVLVSVTAETSTQKLVDGLILLNSAENLSIILLGAV